MLTLTRIDIDGFNDPRAIPCQQSFASCDQVATIHIVGTHQIDATEFDVDVCPEHAGTVVINWAEILD